MINNPGGVALGGSRDFHITSIAHRLPPSGVPFGKIDEKHPVGAGKSTFAPFDASSSELG